MPKQTLFVGNPALIVVDIQCGAAMPYDLTGIGHMDGWRDRIDRAEHLVAGARAAGVPVIFFQEVHRRSGVDFGRELDGAEGVHCLEGEEATALWPTHSEVVEPTAVRLTFAGMIYATDDHDVRKLTATLQPVNETFRATLEKVRALDVPASMQRVHERYVEALALYVKASAEMLKVAQDSSDRHLVEAQMMSKLASEELLKAGDVLWPGEHKPN